MKNEDRILELLAETLQRIDQHNEQIKLQGERLDRLIEEMKLQREGMKLQGEEMKLQQESMILQLDVNRALLTKIQQHDERLDRHADGIDLLRERSELMRQTALEQQKAYRDSTELLMFHNKALREKGLL